jgi:defect in organelle trafficking protein DotA
MKPSTKKLLTVAALLALPTLALAATNPINPTDTSALSFNPPATDVSIALLQTIFGIVDGVLHGSGSQIMGQMFKIFNGAVLVLGGMIIMYTLFVSTLRTAHEGEMMGQKWSSIWIPIRSAGGIALLLPKASGYCLIQIFFMFLVVQGVGAADKVWDAALTYLQTGGQIIAPALDTKGPHAGELGGVFPTRVEDAGKLLQSTICMDGLQSLLLNRRKKNMGIQGYTYEDLGTPPSFLASIDVVGVQGNALPSQDTLTVNFPNIRPPNKYARFNGVCGSMTWKRFSPADKANLQKTLNISGGLLDQVMQARALAIQQMYLEISGSAQLIVNNEINVEPQYQLPFGKPNQNNTVWVSPTSKPALLRGTELTDAATDYFAVLQPTLRALSGKAQDKSETKFIEDARNRGWILAGSYFFDLANISQKNEQAASEQADRFAVAAPNSLQTNAALKAAAAPDKNQLNQDDINNLMKMVEGANADPNRDITKYIKEAKTFERVRIQPGKSFSFSGWDPGFIRMEKVRDFCPSSTDFEVFDIDIGKGLCDFTYDSIVDPVVNDFIGKIVVEQGLNEFMKIIGTDIVRSFINFSKYIDQNSNMNMMGQANPLITLAQVGSDFITAAGSVWVGGGIVLILIGLFSAGIPIAFMMTIGVPITAVLVALTVTGIGFAFYIPMLPYIIFTFAAVGWFIAVIEAMVAAPIVALGVAHPEGQHEVFGMGNPAIMLMLNVFLRPSMMVIGLIAGISLSFVSVWLVNAGFAHVTERLDMQLSGIASLIAPAAVIILYAIIVITVVKKSFELIYIIPDKILRWLEGGMAETLGQETAGMAAKAEEMHKGAAQQVGGTAKETAHGAGELATKGTGKGGGGGASGGSSTNEVLPPVKGRRGGGGGASAKRKKF